MRACVRASLGSEIEIAWADVDGRRYEVDGRTGGGGCVRADEMGSPDGSLRRRALGLFGGLVGAQCGALSHRRRARPGLDGNGVDEGACRERCWQLPDLRAHTERQRAKRCEQPARRREERVVSRAMQCRHVVVRHAVQSGADSSAIGQWIKTLVDQDHDRRTAQTSRFKSTASRRQDRNTA
ncbi:hypothetical protein BD413DRAFT_572574 [Trametes elegans]|nr:hypothetical protein BD413DRAFT_572574 [Trametes elegans]